jgi:NAD(P)H-hydrate epimerase
VRRLVADLEYPAVIDADGLYPLSGDDSPLRGEHAPLVLTPHPGEFARLTGVMPEAHPIRNYDLVAEWARTLKSVIVLKGSPTLVASPDGEVYLNPTGNWGMATGGSGDVLTGIITALLGQKLTPLDAALCGVYLHGLAGDLAAEQIHPRSLVAGDLITFLSRAFTVVDAGHAMSRSRLDWLG